uniref:Uncharacterized protein n=1 Tax=Opuntia streptacantha TaxID=393608 RepID=A0A7C9DMI7_OPUST
MKTSGGLWRASWTVLRFGGVQSSKNSAIVRVGHLAFAGRCCCFRLCLNRLLNLGRGVKALLKLSECTDVIFGGLNPIRVFYWNGAHCLLHWCITMYIVLWL